MPTLFDEVCLPLGEKAIMVTEREYFFALIERLRYCFNMYCH